MAEESQEGVTMVTYSVIRRDVDMGRHRTVSDRVLGERGADEMRIDATNSQDTSTD